MINWMKPKPKYEVPSIVICFDKNGEKRLFLALKRRYGNCNDSFSKYWWYSGMMMSIVEAEETLLNSVKKTTLGRATSVQNVQESSIVPIKNLSFLERKQTRRMPMKNKESWLFRFFVRVSRVNFLLNIRPTGEGRIYLPRNFQDKMRGVKK